jgi:hypothetical protein
MGLKVFPTKVTNQNIASLLCKGQGDSVTAISAGQGDIGNSYVIRLLPLARFPQWRSR